MVGKIIKNIVVIGSGNTAWHLIRAYSKKGVRVLQVLAKNERTALKLSKTFSIPYILDPGLLIRDADLYLIAVQDDRISEAAGALRLQDQFLVHTSGFSPLDAIRDFSSNTGVLWPLQTFTSHRAVSFTKVPVFIESDSDENIHRLEQFAGLISKKVIVADSATRQKAHLAAVMASNFSNRLYSFAAELLEQNNLAFEILAPLIIETARKAGISEPAKNQTGPAARNDRKVIARHLELLKDKPEIREMYRLFSENIMNAYHEKTD